MITEHQDTMERILKKLDAMEKAIVGDIETNKPGMAEEIRTIKTRQEKEAEQTQVYRKRVDTVIENHEKRLDEAESTIASAKSKVAAVAGVVGTAGVTLGGLKDKIAALFSGN